MEKITVIVEKAPGNYGAYIENVCGIVATVGDTIDEIKKNIQEALEQHLDVLKELDRPIPKAFQGDYELVYVYDKSVYEEYDAEEDYEPEAEMAVAR
ncbi:MAG: type II toxin-antitoxin system HicB family antitoxin [Bacteroidales bacterium]|nr:type II toxin-antitoxin system HicB family antitoxin [Bacteroidales bacterium]